MKKSQPYMVTRVLYRDFCAAFARDPRTSWVREKHGKMGKLCVTQFKGAIKMYLAKGGAEVNVSIVHEKVNGKWSNPYNKDTKTIKVRVYGVEKLVNDGNSYSGIVYQDNQEVDGYSFDDTSWMTEDDAELKKNHEILKEAKRLLAKYEPNMDPIDRSIALTVPEITVEKYKEREEQEKQEEQETVPAGACAPACCRSAQTSPVPPSSVPADSSPIDAAVPAERSASVPVRPRALRSRRASRTAGTSPRKLIPCTTADTAQRKDWRYQLPRARPCGSTFIVPHRLGAARFYPAVPSDLFL